jgi:hypothetical protein
LYPWAHLLPLSQLELDRNLHHHIDGRAETTRGGESPLPNGIDRALIQASTESLEHFQVADRPVRADDNLENDVSLDPPSPCFLRVIRPDLAKESRGRNATAWPVWPAAGAATGARADSGAGAFSDAGALTAADAGSCTGPVTVGFARCASKSPRAILGVRRRCGDRRNDLRDGRGRWNWRWLDGPGDRLGPYGRRNVPRLRIWRSR